ncbi:MAG: HAMP domain-containing histidine kinase, partial [Planctomycetes bacterium]|nr:HAMP domain-containing histidine kinase [Planctomycetota bacterium]
LRLYSDMLAGGVIHDEQKRNEYIQTMDRETQRLVGLVNDVLEFARLEKHDVQLDRRPISLGELAEIARQRLEPRCQQAGQRLIFDVNGLAEAQVDTDSQLLLQILDILVDNACKYGGSSDQSAIEIRTLRLPNGRVALEVQDDGPGIPRKNRRTIFRPFRRGCSLDSQQTGGIGLGLALAKRWARLLDGHLELLTPNPSRSGACFRFTFPK